jgi:hypothetical protein
MRDLVNTTATRGILGTIASVLLGLSPEDWSHIASITVAVLTGGYIVYKWRRDARERTCDKAACPLRHRPE